MAGWEISWESTASDVVAWLESLDLGKYSAKVLDLNVDGPSLLDECVDIPRLLKDMGIKSIGHKHLLKKNILKLRESAEPPGSYEDEDVSDYDRSDAGDEEVQAEVFRAPELEAPSNTTAELNTSNVSLATPKKKRGRNNSFLSAKSISSGGSMVELAQAANVGGDGFDRVASMSKPVPDALSDPFQNFHAVDKRNSLISVDESDRVTNLDDISSGSEPEAPDWLAKSTTGSTSVLEASPVAQFRMLDGPKRTSSWIVRKEGFLLKRKQTPVKALRQTMGSKLRWFVAKQNPDDLTESTLEQYEGKSFKHEFPLKFAFVKICGSKGTELSIESRGMYWSLRPEPGEGNAAELCESWLVLLKELAVYTPPSADVSLLSDGGANRSQSIALTPKKSFKSESNASRSQSQTSRDPMSRSQSGRLEPANPSIEKKPPNGVGVDTDVSHIKIKDLKTEEVEDDSEDDWV